MSTIILPLWKIYNSKAQSFEEVKADIQKNGHTLDQNRLQNIHELFWVPWNQVVIAAEVLAKRNVGDAQKISLSQKLESKKIWGPWGDMALYRKQGAGTNNVRMGVLTKVDFNTVKNAVNKLNQFPDIIAWSAYVRWAIGDKTLFNGALVDETSEKKRPNSQNEEPKSTSKPEYMPYRNYYDVLAWCFGNKVQEKLDSVSDTNRDKWNKRKS